MDHVGVLCIPGNYSFPVSGHWKSMAVGAPCAGHFFFEISQANSRCIVMASMDAWMQGWQSRDALHTCSFIAAKHASTRKVANCCYKPSAVHVSSIFECLPCNSEYWWCLIDVGLNKRNIKLFCGGQSHLVCIALNIPHTNSWQFFLKVLSH